MSQGYQKWNGSHTAAQVSSLTNADHWFGVRIDGVLYERFVLNSTAGVTTWGTAVAALGVAFADVLTAVLTGTVLTITSLTNSAASSVLISEEQFTNGNRNLLYYECSACVFDAPVPGQNPIVNFPIAPVAGTYAVNGRANTLKRGRGVPSTDGVGAGILNIGDKTLLLAFAAKLPDLEFGDIDRTFINSAIADEELKNTLEDICDAYARGASQAEFNLIIDVSDVSLEVKKVLCGLFLAPVGPVVSYHCEA